MCVYVCVSVYIVWNILRAYTHWWLFCLVDKISEGVVLVSLKCMEDKIKDNISISSCSFVT